MNYFEELNRFWKSGITCYLWPNASLLYLCLLDIANSRHWPQRFAVTSFVLEENTGIAKRSTLYEARNRLSQVGLIRFSGMRGSKLVEYEILGVENALVVITKNPQQPIQKADNSPRTCRELAGNLPGTENREPKSDKPPEVRQIKQKQNINGVSNDTPEPPINEPQKPKKEPKPKNPKPKEPVNSDHQRIMGHYYNSFQEKFGVKPVIAGGKDGKTIKDLLAQKPADELIILLNDFFESEDSWIKNSGYTLGAFLSQINKLSTLRARAPTDNQEYSRKKALIKKLYLT